MNKKLKTKIRNIIENPNSTPTPFSYIINEKVMRKNITKAIKKMGGIRKMRLISKQVKKYLSEE